VASGFVSRQAPTGGTKLREGATVDIWVSKGSASVDLPDFKEWTASAVDEWLSKNDLQGDPRTGKSNSVAEGQVFKQDPAAAAKVKRGDTDTYWVSSGKPQAEVPDLVNRTQSEAETAIGDAGLTLGTVTQDISTTVPPGSVISQDPVAGTKVDRGSPVSFVVSTGSPSPSPSPSPTAAGVAVPNVYGMQSTAAAAELSAAGLTPSFRQKANTGQEPGTVVRIKPDAGTVVPDGSTVLLVIAS
jgi:serine/threonine-protein kinase